MPRFVSYLRGLMARRRVERETDAELRFHIEMEAEANRARGMAADEARQAAMREFGGVTQARESVRHVRTTWIDGAWQDLRYSVRALRRSPGFSLMAVLILGLGIGASTAAFSIVSAVFFKALAVPEADRLVYVYSVTDRGQRHPSFGVESVRSVEGHYDKAFSGVTAHWLRTVTLGADGESSYTRGEVVTANYFDVVGVTPLLGRTFEPEEDDPSNPSLGIVISHDLWMRRFKRAPDILGKQVRVNNRMFSVIGVMKPEFEGLSDPWGPSRFWVCVMQLEPERAGARPYTMGTVARLKPGVTQDEAQAIVDVHGPQIQAEWLREVPVQYRRTSAQVVVPATRISNPFFPDQWLIEPRVLSAIGVVVAIVLLISATNIAGVLAARSVTRAREVAVRQALGAGTARLVRQLLIESVVVAIAGGAFGLVLARLIVDAYQAFAPSQFMVNVAFDGRVALFTLAVCIGAGVLVGLAPAMQARSVNVVVTLAGGAGGGRRVKRRLRHAILIPQIALSMVLLIVAGVHVRSLSRIETADVGYRVENVVTMRVDHWDNWRYSADRSKAARERFSERDRAFYRALYDGISTVPVDGGIAIATTLPPRSWTMPGRFISQAGLLAGGTDTARADAMQVSPGYFKTMGITLLRGRDFDARDAMTSTHVAVISDALAQRLWPAGSALGQLLAWHAPGQTAAPWWLEVVGVVSETTPVQQDIGARPMLYTNLAQRWDHYSFIVVAADRGDQVHLVQRLKTAVEGADAFAEVLEVRSMAQVVDEILYPRRAAVAILIACGLVGLILSSIGIYGVISHSIAQRLQEIGIRTTLGADRRAILILMLREATMVTLAGAVPGLFVGLIATRLTSNVVGAVPPFDAVTFVVIPVLTMAVILTASYIPARRASRMDPMAVLRGL